MSELSDKLQKLKIDYEIKNKKKLTGEVLGQALNISQVHANDILAGRKKPSIELITALARFFNTSTDYLTGLTNDPRSALTFDEFAEAVAPQTPDGARLDFLKSSGKIIQVPIYGKELAACCGGGFPDSDQIYAEAEEFIAMPSGFLGPVSADPNYQPFIIYAEGDSMVNAGIHDGAQVIINPYDDVLDGDAALVEFATNPVTKNIAIKRVYWLDRRAVEIRSACGDGWKRTFTADDFDEKSIRIIGKVEWVGNKPKRG